MKNKGGKPGKGRWWRRGHFIRVCIQGDVKDISP